MIVFQNTVAVLGYGPEANGPVLELTYNYGVTNYDKGNGYTQVNSVLFLSCAEDFMTFGQSYMNHNASHYKKYVTHLVFKQIAIGTNDVYKTAEAIKLYGGKIIREPGPLPGINTKIVVCLDPDGWKLVWNFSFLFLVCNVLLC